MISLENRLVIQPAGTNALERVEHLRANLRIVSCNPGEAHHISDVFDANGVAIGETVIINIVSSLDRMVLGSGTIQRTGPGDFLIFP